MTAQPILHGETDLGDPVTLRPAASRDIDAVLKTSTDEETLRWINLAPNYTRERAEGFVDGYAPGFWERGEGAVWVIADAGDQYVGQIDLRVFPKDKQVADVGFMAAPWARGKGYMTAALRVAVKFGLSDLGLARIEWRAQVGNVASRRVAEKAGFRLEGVQRQAIAQGDTRHDAWMAAVVREDFA